MRLHTKKKTPLKEMKENSGILAARVAGTFGRTGEMLFLLRGLGHGFTAGLLSLYSSQMNIKQWPVQRRRKAHDHTPTP